MKRIPAVFLLGLVCSLWLMAQEPARVTAAQEKSSTQTEEQGDPWMIWKWANFLILVGGLGYLGKKFAGSFFQDRTAQIQRSIDEANKYRQEAERRAGHMEERLSLLAADIDALRREARGEMNAEAERIRRATAEQAAKLQARARQEIEALTRAAKNALKAHAAQLAVDLARQRIESQMSPTTQGVLVDSFARELERRRPASP